MKKKRKGLIRKVVIGISVLLLLLVIIVSVKGLEPSTGHIDWGVVNKGVFNHNVFSIFGVGKVVVPGQNLNFSVDLPAQGEYEGNYSKGVLTVRYGNCALIDKNNNVFYQGSWQSVTNKFVDNISVVAPNKIGEYALVCVITESKGVFENGSWEWSNESVNNKEAFKFSVTAPQPTNTPTPSSIMSWLGNVWSWIKSLFGI